MPPCRLLATFRTNACSRSYGRDDPAVAVPLHSENLHAKPRSPICVVSHTLRLSAAHAGSPISTGTPQGGPLSPLLSNLLLDDLDTELARRGHRFCRYADDCNIYVRSRRAGERVIASVSQFLTTKLRLKVNEAKSAVARPEERKFLGFTISNDGSSGASRQRPSISSRRGSGT